MISQTSMLLQQSAADQKKRQLLEKMRAKKIQQQEQQNTQQKDEQITTQENTPKQKDKNYDKGFLQSLQDLQVDKNEDKQLSQQINQELDDQAKYTVLKPKKQIKPQQQTNNVSKYFYKFNDNDFAPNTQDIQLSNNQQKQQSTDIQQSTQPEQQEQTIKTGNAVIGKTVQNLFKMLPSDQKRCLDLLKQQQTEVQIEYDKQGNALITLLALQDSQYDFERKRLIKQQFYIKQDEIPQGQFLKERESQAIQDYIQRKQEYELKQQEQASMTSMHLQESNQLKSLLWINKQIIDTMKSRLQFLQFESKGLKKEENYYSMFNQQVNTVDLDSLFTKEETKPLSEELAGSELVTSLINQKSDKCPLITLEEFITQQAINNQLQIKVETYIEQFQNALLYYSKYSAACRFMLLFMPEVCPTYELYAQVTNTYLSAQPAIQQFIYRKSEQITADEFEQIRSRHQEIFIAILLVFQVMIKHSEIQRVNLPINQETVQAGLPKIISAYIVQYLDFKPFAGNVLARLFSRFNGDQYTTGTKLSLMNSGFIMNELQGFGIWVKNKEGQYEAELFCVLICLTRVLNAVFQEINNYDEQ